MLFDNNSKFGTLVQINKQMEIKPDKMAIQYGRTIVTLIQKKSEGQKAKQQSSSVDPNAASNKKQPIDSNNLHKFNLMNLFTNVKQQVEQHILKKQPKDAN